MLTSTALLRIPPDKAKGNEIYIYLMLTSPALLRISPAKSSLKLQTVKFLNYFPIEK